MREPEIKELAKIADNLIADLYSKNPKSSVFEQEGILNGRDIVLDYIHHNEIGLATEHLLYMIHESEIDYPREKLICLHKIADSLKLNVFYNLPNPE